MASFCDDFSSDSSDYSDIDSTSSSSFHSSFESDDDDFVWNNSPTLKARAAMIDRIFGTILKIENIQRDNHSMNQSKKNYKIRKQRQSLEYDSKTTIIKTEKNNLYSFCLDELLQRAMSFEPNLRWNQHNEWCRYCGARASFCFYPSRMGLLCHIHYKLHKDGHLNLSLFVQPTSIESVINKSSNTEKRYLIDLILQQNKIENVSDSSLYFSDFSDYESSEYVSSDSENEPIIKKEYSSNQKIKLTKYEQPTLNHNDVNLMQLHKDLFSKRIDSKIKFEPPSNDETLQTLQRANYTQKQLQILKKKRMQRLNLQKATKSKPIRHISDVFVCSHCNKTFVGAQIFQNHCIDAHDDRYCFDCNQCENSYTSKNNLAYHMRKIHDGVINFHCHQCKRPFFERNEWKRHSAKCNVDYYLLDCTLCDDINVTFESQPKWREHMNTVHGIQRPYECIKCLKNGKKVCYETKAGLTMHFRRDHLRERPYECTKCEKSFYSKEVLAQHQRVHDGLRPFKCVHCGLRYSVRSSLRCHINNIHLKIKRFECKHCGKRFAEKTGLRSHCAAVHGDDEMARFECHICHKRWYEKGIYFKHMANAHKAKDPIKEMIKNGECPYNGCNKRYFSKNCAESVKYHLVNTHKDRKYAKYECKRCDKLFYDKTSYTEHKEKRH